MYTIYSAVVNQTGKIIEVWQLLNYNQNKGKHWCRIGVFNTKTEEGLKTIPYKKRKGYKSLRGFRKGIEEETGKINWDTPLQYNWTNIDEMQQHLHHIHMQNRKRTS